jgi:hypothetical protein
MICHGSVSNAQAGNVSFAISDTAESGNPNAQETAILPIFMQPTVTMILAIQRLYSSAFVRLVTAHTIIAIV